ncbi:MAG: S8 family serine peptidase, partial [Gemmataceae bacterium]
MFHPRQLAAAFALLFLALTAAAEDAGGKLDDGLDGLDKKYAVFVRMEDQLFKKGGDFEKFCADNSKARRSEMRRRVLETLRTKADASWQQVAGKVKALEKDGSVQDVTRFWIVNGFACEATGKACRELAADKAVSFVYLQRGPARQQRAEAPGQLSDEQKQTYISILKDWKDDADRPLGKELEIPWNLKQLQADQVWTKEKITGKGVVVAVADTGLLMIPPLMQALWRNPKEEINGKDDDGNGFVDDLFGYDFAAQGPFVLGDSGVPHGSACAGIIAGRPLNDKSLITGVAPRARVMMLRGMGYLRSYEYALANGADVISMSYMWVNVELGNYRGVFRLAHEHLTAGG